MTLQKLHRSLIKQIQTKGATLLSLASYEAGKTYCDVVTPFDNCHNCYSIAKVFIVTAIGMLADENRLDTSDKVFDILETYFPKDFHPKWKQVTIHDLLTHTFGISSGFLDIDAEDPSKFGTDYLAYCFSIPLYDDMMNTRVYSDGAYYILSRVIAKISGEDVCSYLRKKLFIPLGFKEIAWSVCPHGYSMGATGLYIRTDDMVKLGALYLEDGIFNGERIISKKWVDTVFEQGYELRPRKKKQGCYAKGGMYGQMLYIDKANGFVLAWHSHDRCGASKKAMDKLEL